jgi:hypothetical protein
MLTGRKTLGLALPGAILLVLATHPRAATRCDLVSQAPRCLDLASLDGATVQVPAATTRIPASGLVLCGIPGSVPPPTDIVYAVDQTASMVPTAILPGTEDTSGWYECNKSLSSPKITFVDTLLFHGQSVGLITPGTPLDTLKKVCKVAGDPYSVRSSTIQSAIATQAAAAPGSYAATVNFGPGITSQDSMTSLSSAANIAALQASIPLNGFSGTNYEIALTWARILLYGGHSATRTIPPSKDPNKAIIIISDGRPSAGTWKNFLKATTSVKVGDTTWTTDAPPIPPVYGIYLGIDTVEGSELATIADTTGGRYFRIPPFMPDSLGRVIDGILGSLIQPAAPETLLVRNLTNGQSAIAVTSTSAGANAYRMALDSIVGLETGANQLSLSLKESGQTIGATWTVNVGGSSLTGTKGTDTLLSDACGPGSSLSLAPDRSGLPWADTADRAVVATLKTIPSGNSSLPLVFTTVRSSDREQTGAPVPATAAKDSTGVFRTSLPWQGLAPSGPVTGDLVIRSGYGWDTVYAFFQMPRDKRDTAWARLGLHHPAAPVLTLTPSVVGPAGQVLATVVDSESTSATVQVVVRHRLGDTLAVTLVRGGDGTYRGSFAFAQGVAADPRDTLLELGAAGIDSLWGTYLVSRATTQVLAAPHHPVPVLSLEPSVEGPDGRILATVVDSESTALSVQVVVRHRLGDTLAVTLVRGADGIYRGSFSFVQGLMADLRDTVLEVGPLGLDSLWGTYKTSRATTIVQAAKFHLRFLDTAGLATDSLGFDLRVGERRTVTVQVWVGSRFCPACAGRVDIDPPDPALSVQSAAGTEVASLPLVGGQISVSVLGRSPLLSGSIRFRDDSLGAEVAAQPIRVLPRAPDSLVYLDLDGDGRLDRVVLYSALAWHATSGLKLPWPDSLHLLPWAASALSLSADSLVASFDFPPQGVDTTGFTGRVAALWQWGPGFPWVAVPVHERIAPVPVRATYRVADDPATPDTLFVSVSEPVVAGVQPWVAVGRPSQGILGRAPRVVDAQLTDSGRTLRLLVHDTDVVRFGDSLRLAAFSTGGTIADLLGNRPGDTAKWVPIRWMEPSPRLELEVPNPIARASEASVPSNEPAISVLVRPAEGSAWGVGSGSTSPDLSTPEGRTRLGGVVVRLNRLPRELGVYIYDNMGVAVLSHDVTDIESLAQAGILARTRRGDYEIWLAWDGKDQNGRLASTGVYTFRVFGRVEDGSQLFLLNQIRKTGFHAGTR